jgi:hypothetical protein
MCSASHAGVMPSLRARALLEVLELNRCLQPPRVLSLMPMHRRMRSHRSFVLLFVALLPPPPLPPRPLLRQVIVELLPQDTWAPLSGMQAEDLKL